MATGKRVAIMQPYFLPYIGYWQLMAYVDEFVVYDDIQFTKRGWIHRNRYLNGHKDQMFTLPLKRDSDYLDVAERRLSDSWATDKNKLYRKVKMAYQKAPFFEEGAATLEDCIFYDSDNLFDFIFHSIKVVSRRLDIGTRLIVSSELGDTTDRQGQARVLKICDLLEATEYVNPAGGRDLYDAEVFSSHGVDLRFHHIGQICYCQFGADFIPNLSIIDVLMFNGVEEARDLLSHCDIHA